MEEADEPMTVQIPERGGGAKVANLPHTKLLGGAWKMLAPLRLTGWAQVALTPVWRRRDTNQPGSHWSWQSHRKLSLWMRLEKEPARQRTHKSTHRKC